MKQITEICDKIIELSKKTNQDSWQYFKDHKDDYRIDVYYDGYNEYGKKQIKDCIGTARSEEKARIITTTANHAAKLAMALKLVMEKIEPHRDVICRGYECCAYCRTLEGLANDIKDEIEEIFNKEKI